MIVIVVLILGGVVCCIEVDLVHHNPGDIHINVLKPVQAVAYQRYRYVITLCDEDDGISQCRDNIGIADRYAGRGAYDNRVVAGRHLIQQFSKLV